MGQSPTLTGLVMAGKFDKAQPRVGVLYGRTHSRVGVAHIMVYE